MALNVAQSLTHLFLTARRRFREVSDAVSVALRCRHTIEPAQIGNRPHDCGPASLYWAAPHVPETRILEAFNSVTSKWPYGGVTNKEFAIVLKYLRVDTAYSTEINTLAELLSTSPARCVALLHGHFIAIVDGAVVGNDSNRHWPRDTHVYCHWSFTRPPFPWARNPRRSFSCTA